MKRLLAVFVCIAALVMLGLFLLDDIASLPQQANGAVTAVASDGHLQLELSRQLARPPVQNSLPVADDWFGRTVAPIRSVLATFSQLDQARSRPLIYLAAAALVGLFLGLLTRSPVAATLESQPAPEQTETISALRAELDERGDAIRDLEQDMARQVAAAADKLSQKRI